MAKNYWQDREAAALAKITGRSVKETEKLLAKSYANSARKVVEEFEATYEKLLNTIEDGRDPTPADLYKLDKYWEMSAKLNFELRALGEKQEKILSKKFLDEFAEIYGAISFNDIKAFSTIDREGMVKAINSIWCADGKTWSQRIWKNVELLQETLQEELIHCVTAGKKTTELKNLLQERFDVSYRQADSVVRTEMAHIQTSAAKQRYSDYGIQEVQVWADKDERRCEVCGKLHMKKFPIHAAMPIPAHPRCRCSIIPVVEM
jgi:SPP1 gp7 family putative phage head morphogenesis protein